MRVLITCVVLALLASCDSKESCEDRGGLWGRECGIAGCSDPYCHERLASAGKPCTGHKDCPDGLCEAPCSKVPCGALSGFGGSGGIDAEPVVGRCCDHEGCWPRYVVEGGRVMVTPIRD